MPGLATQKDTARFRRDRPGPPHAAQRFRDRQPGLKAVFMKACTEIRATEPGSIAPLKAVQLPLRRDPSTEECLTTSGYRTAATNRT